MKYRKILILLGVIIIVFIAAGIAYSQLSQNDAIQSTSTAPSSTAAAANTSDSTAAASANEGANPDETTSPAQEGLAVGNLAYDFTLQNYDGEDVTLSDLRGKIVILNFWASWCGPCKNEMPEFQIMQDKFTALGDEADTVFLTVNLADGMRETRDTAKAFLDDTGYTFPVVFDEGKVATLYEIYSIPTTYVLDSDGVIVKMFLGSTNQEALEEAIETAKS